MQIVFVKIILIPIFFYGFANWLMWQKMKVGTDLPGNNKFKDKGAFLSKFIKTLYFFILFKFALENGWYYLFTFIIIWYFSGWFATLLERYLYMNKVMDIAKEKINNAEGNLDIARENLAKAIPNWWVLLMPPKWKNQIESYLKEIL